MKSCVIFLHIVTATVSLCVLSIPAWAGLAPIYAGQTLGANGHSISTTLSFLTEAHRGCRACQAPTWNSPYDLLPPPSSYHLFAQSGSTLRWHTKTSNINDTTFYGYSPVNYDISDSHQELLSTDHSRNFFVNALPEITTHPTDTLLPNTAWLLGCGLLGLAGLRRRLAARQQ